MATHMIQFSYSTDSVQGLVKKPQNRREAAEKIFTAAGGTIEDMYFSFGDYDGVVLARFPSNVDVAACFMAVGASGGFSKIQTTVLISMEDGMKAMKKAHDIVGSYSAPTG